MTHIDEGFSFIWKIENFSMLPHQNRERLESPSFVVKILDNTKWRLWLYPKGTDLNVNYLSLFLCRSDWDTNKTASKLNCNLTLVSVDSKCELSMLFENKVISIGPAELGINLNNLELFNSNINLYAPQDILTIRCHIWPSQEQCHVPAITRKFTTLYNYFENRYSARTTIDVQKRVLTWPITNINKLENSREKVSIDLANSSEDSPAFKLCFYIDKTLNDEYARIEILETKSSKNHCLFVKCKITVVGADEEHHTSSQDSHLFSSNVDEIWQFPDFILIENIAKGYAYIDNTMFLQCEFSFSRKGSERHLEIPMYVPVAFAEKERSESTELSFARFLFERKQFSDVELRSGGRTFPCHKIVLCTQSPVFNAMFTCDMKEKKTGVVEIADGDPQTLQRMLKFLYLEVIEDGLSDEELCKLYAAADKYEISVLRRRCSLLLLSKLSVASVCLVLVVADTHQGHFLSSHVHNFLSIHAREVFHSPQWETFMVDHPTLSKDTMIKIYMEEPCF